jgi:hypothetical protein
MYAFRNLILKSIKVKRTMMPWRSFWKRRMHRSCHHLLTGRTEDLRETSLLQAQLTLINQLLKTLSESDKGGYQLLEGIGGIQCMGIEIR